MGLEKKIVFPDNNVCKLYSSFRLHDLCRPVELLVIQLSLLQQGPSGITQVFNCPAFIIYSPAFLHFVHFSFLIQNHFFKTTTHYRQYIC